MSSLLLSLLALSSSVLLASQKRPAPSDEVKALVARVQAFYEKTTDFTASFRQQYTYQSFNRKQTSEGKVFFLKPAMMRWEYQKPSPKSFVLDGEKVYAYDPEAMTLTIASLRSNQLSASVTFLWGQGKLEKEFAISRVECGSCRGTLLEMIPHKPDPRFQKIKLEVDPRSSQVLRSIVIDPDGSENEIAFSDFRANQKLSKEQFKLQPPPGTQVVDLTQRPH
jgi:outer membrane lipoprotein carrier protein